MKVKLSTQGRIVIPKEIRQALDLAPGTEFQVELVEGRIILQPLVEKAKVRQIIAEMRHLAGGADLLDLLEAEHRREVAADD